jgi:multimeric flavodoxin WrbA
MTKILAINGSYREGGISDQFINIMSETLRAADVTVDVVSLRDYPIEFCLNCRACTQRPGESPADCVIDDGMQDLVRKIESSDGYILLSPANFYSVTAVFKRFMERLIVYSYWPWSQNSPCYRKAKTPRKKAVLVSSSAAPGLLGRYFFSTHKQLKATAKIIGATEVGVLFEGLVAKDPQLQLSAGVQAKARALALKLS